jgi:uncharacterized protein YjbI with pentapeptide repeats
MSDEHDLTVTRPENLLRKHVKFELKPEDIPDMLAEAIVGIATKDWKSGLTILFKTIGIEGDTLGELAYQLLYSALLKVVKNRVSRLPGASLRDRETKTKLLFKQLVDAVAEAQDVMDYRLLESPQELKAIPAAKQTFEAWLQEHVKDEVQDYETHKRDMLFDFEDDAVMQLFVVAGLEQKKYEALKVLGESNPFYKSRKRIIGKRIYFEWLEAQPDETLLGEEGAPQLGKVYVQPRAYFEDKSKKKRHIVNLEDELDAWLFPANKRDTVRVIAGGPGSGKSSFVTMFAAKHAARREINVLVVPLHRIGHDFDSNDSNLLDAIDHVINNDDGMLAENPIRVSDSERWLIIFDGLDELEALKHGEHVAAAFYKQVKRYILDKNTTKDEPRFNVLLSGRTLIVQSVQSASNHDAVLELMPFYISTNYRKDNDWLERPESFEDDKGLLEQDQRDTWWRRYAEATGKDYKGLPQELQGSNLAEITAQPLLNYLVALSYERDELDFSANPSLNEVYKDLLDSVFDRETKKENSPTDNLTLDAFIRFFEEVARAIWYGNGRTATFQEIEEACQGFNDISKMLDALPSDGGTFSLLTAFYMRYRERSSKTLEFTHKSFSEYLTARRLVTGLKDMETTFKGDKKKKALKEWAELCGQTPIDAYLLEFIRREITLKNEEQVQAWQDMLCTMFDYALREGVPLRDDLPTLKEQKRQARNAEEALLVMLNGCARATKQQSAISLFQESKTVLGTWVHNVRGQREGIEFVAALVCISRLNCTGQVLGLQDLRKADLTWSNLTGVDLMGADLERASIFFANLNGADLSGADLGAVDLARAQLIGAILAGANLAGAYLGQAKLMEANLGEANLAAADLMGADLRGANLRGADLSGADLSGANLSKVDLREVNLIGTNVGKAELAGATIVCHQLNQTNFEFAKNMPTVIEDDA